jgi:hypothetical protein
LATAAAVDRRGSSSRIVAAAKMQTPRARCNATNMLASLCFTAWNDPIGTPN